MMRLQHFVRVLDSLLRYLLIVLMAALVVDVCWQVITRFILDNPSSYTEEIARFTLIWLSLLGAASAYRRGLHLGIDIAVQKLPASRRRLVDALVHLLVALFACSILIYGGIKLVMLTLHLEQLSAVLGVKMGLIYMVMPLSGLFFLIFALAFISEKLSKENLVDADSRLDADSNLDSGVDQPVKP